MKKKAEDQQNEKGAFTDRIPDPDRPGSFYEYTAKEKLFVNAYLTDAKFVGSTAARMAGYNAGSDLAFRVIASNVMKKPRIRAAINEAFESLTMPKFEILFRLARIASGSLEDVLNDDGEFDIDVARDRDTAHLLKKIQITRDVVEVKASSNETPDGDETIERSIFKETIKFEIHDPLRALELLGKHSKLFADKIEVTGKDGQPLNDPANVVIYIPDNGRGDLPDSGDQAAAGKPAGRKRRPKAGISKRKR